MRYTAIDLVRAVRLFFIIWVFAPFTDGASVVCKAFGTPTRRRKENPLQTVSRQMLDLATRMRVLPSSVRSIASDFVTNWAQLLSLVFLFMPGFLTYYGCILSGKVLPARQSLIVHQAKEQEKIRYWVVYWIVFTTLDLALGVAYELLGWVPLWNQAKLLGIVWLQLPYFHGAESLFRCIDKDLAVKVASCFQAPQSLQNLSQVKSALKMKATKRKQSKTGERKSPAKENKKTK